MNVQSQPRYSNWLFSKLRLNRAKLDNAKTNALFCTVEGISWENIFNQAGTTVVGPWQPSKGSLNPAWPQFWTIFIFPYMSGSTLSQKMPNISSTWGYQTTMMCGKNLEKTQTQKRHGQKMMHPAIASANVPSGQKSDPGTMTLNFHPPLKFCKKGTVRRS